MFPKLSQFTKKGKEAASDAAWQRDFGNTKWQTASELAADARGNEAMERSYNYKPVDKPAAPAPAPAAPVRAKGPDVGQMGDWRENPGYGYDLMH